MFSPLLSAMSCLIPIFFVVSTAWAWPIPDSGQDKCYDDVGNVIECPQPGEPFFGQDANYSINPRSYTKLDAQGNALQDNATEWVMVKDNVTGLIWEVKTDDGGIRDRDDQYTFGDAKSEFITELNKQSFGGHSDWRMPTINELALLADLGSYKSAIDTGYFPNTASSSYWTSTSNADDAYGGSSAWLVNLTEGYDHYGNNNKKNSYYVRAVRGGKSVSFDNFIIHDDGTVSDPNTGLMWQRTTADKEMTWSEALDYCENLGLAGYTDWRLPTREELRSIVNYNTSNPALNEQAFPDTVSSSYFSSTTNALNESNARLVYFNYGSDGSSHKSNSYYVRAVRGGQNWSFDHLVIFTPGQSTHLLAGNKQEICWNPQQINEKVQILLSREGGKEGTFKTIASNIDNDGSYFWTVTRPPSYNCMLRIEPINAPSKGNSQGLFTINALNQIWTQINPQQSFQSYAIDVTGKLINGSTQELNATYTLSDTSLAQMQGNILTAQETGRVEVTAKKDGLFDKSLIYLITSPDDMEMEINNSPANADFLLPSQYMQGEMLEDDLDDHQFTLAESGPVDIAFLNTSETADCLIELLDEDEQEVAQTTSADGEQATIRRPLTAGDYYLKVSSNGDVDQDGLYYLSYWPKETQMISLGQSYEKGVYSAQDRTDFALHLETAQDLEINFEPDGSDLYLNLLGQDGALLMAVNATQQHGIPVSLPAGEYAWQVGHADPMDEHSVFTLQLNPYNGTQEEVEINDTISQALPLPYDQQIQGHLLEGDQDFFAFDLTAPQYINLNFHSNSTVADYRLILYKDGPNQIDQIICKDGQGVDMKVGLTAGSYSLKVESAGDLDEADHYYLTLSEAGMADLEIEPNNVLNFANALPPDVVQQGRIASDQDVDFWGFTLSETGMFQADFNATNTGADYVIRLLNGAGTVLSEKTSTDGQAVTLYGKQAPGSYFVKITAGQDTESSSFYALALNADAPASPLKKLVSISLSAEKSNLEPGASTKVTVLANYSDGSALEVSQSASLQSSNESVLSITDGQVTAVGQDIAASITASYQGKADSIVLKIGQAEAKQTHGNLIIVAGGSQSEADSLKAATKYVTDLAYQKFQARNFQDEDIYYLSESEFHDLDGDGYDDQIVDDASPAVADVQSALETWATDQDSDGPLYVYLADHGVKDQFMVATNEILSASQLKSSLDAFQQDSGREVVVLIEACYSGSFVDDLESDTYERLILTSADGATPSYLSTDGSTSFSSFILTYLYQGKSLAQSLILTKQDLAGVGAPYANMSPQFQGAEALQDLQVGGNFVLAGVFPEITDMTQEQTVSPADALDLSVTVSSAVGGLEVWAVIVPPEYTPPSVSEDSFDTPTDELPRVDLTDEDANKNLDGVYTGSFSDLTYSGDYTVTFYAKDGDNNLTKSAPVSITVTDGETLPTTSTTTSTTTTTTTTSTTSTTVLSPTTTTTSTTSTTTVSTSTSTSSTTTTTTTVPPVLDVSLDLNDGWNLAGCPVQPDDSSIEQLIVPIQEQLISAWAWEDANWSVYLPSMTEQEAAGYIQSKGFVELEHIHAGQGFWLNLSQNASLNLSGGKQTQNSLDADSGWSLLAVKSDKNLSVADLIAEIQEGVSFWKWSGSSWNVFLPQEEDNGTSYAQSKGFGILEEIEPGEGFWVNCQ